MLKKFEQYCLILENESNNFYNLGEYFLKIDINKTVLSDKERTKFNELDKNGKEIPFEERAKLFNFYNSVVDDRMKENFKKIIPTLVDELLLLKSEQKKQDVNRTKEKLKEIKNLLKMNDLGESKFFPQSNIEFYLKKSNNRQVGDLHKLLVSVMKDFKVL
jgi:hypothetical protein